LIRIVGLLQNVSPKADSSARLFAGTKERAFYWFFCGAVQMEIRDLFAGPAAFDG
jgi:hypothetical protein